MATSFVANDKTTYTLGNQIGKSINYKFRFNNSKLVGDIQILPNQYKLSNLTIFENSSSQMNPRNG
jgi:hypothetical protein